MIRRDTMNFKGQAKRLDDIDLPLIGRQIGVGEDEIHALLDVESAGSGFDKQGRPKILFEPHVFWRELGPGPKRDKAVAQGLAYPRWKPGAYPKDSYPRLLKAMSIDEDAALRSSSWGLPQLMGFNATLAGYPSAKAMVLDFLDDEDRHLDAMVKFIRARGLDDKLRRHDWKGFAAGYNGPGFAKNGYDLKLAQAFARWQKNKDTPIPAGHVIETPVSVTRPAPHVNAAPAKRPAQSAKPAAQPSPAKPGSGAVAALLGGALVLIGAKIDAITAWASEWAHWAASFFN